MQAGPAVAFLPAVILDTAQHTIHYVADLADQTLGPDSVSSLLCSFFHFLFSSSPALKACPTFEYQGSLCFRKQGEAQCPFQNHDLQQTALSPQAAASCTKGQTCMLNFASAQSAAQFSVHR